MLLHGTNVKIYLNYLKNIFDTAVFFCAFEPPFHLCLSNSGFNFKNICLLSYVIRHPDTGRICS